jgi:hypothetical protein
MTDQAKGPPRPDRKGPAAVTTPSGVGSEPHVGTPAASPAEPSSFTHLLRQLMDDVAVLLRKELALATSEVVHAVDDAKQGAKSMVIGGAVLYAGLLFLLAAATLGLAEVMSAWLAALIVGGSVAVIGLVMVQAGKKKMESGNFAPNRAADSVRKDKDMLARHSHEQ